MQELERNYAPLNPQQNPLGCTRQETRKGEVALGTTLPVQTTLKTQDKRQTVQCIADTTKHQLRRLKKKRLSIIYTETVYGNFYGNMASIKSICESDQEYVRRVLTRSSPTDNIQIHSTSNLEYPWQLTVPSVFYNSHRLDHEKNHSPQKKQ